MIGVVISYLRTRLGRRLIGTSFTSPSIALRPDPITLDRMREGLETMDQSQRTIFERVRLDGRNYHQIAHELGLTAQEVEACFASALLHLWRHMDGQNGQ